MLNVVSLILPVPPSANRYWRTVVNRKSLRAMTFVSIEAMEYKATVRALAQIDRPTDEEVIVTVKWFRAIRSGDLDNRIKCLLDALEGVVYENDKQICEMHTYRFDDPKRPRVEVEIRVVPAAQAQLIDLN